jgi:hypothetical protein
MNLNLIMDAFAQQGEGVSQDQFYGTDPLPTLSNMTDGAKKDPFQKLQTMTPGAESDPFAEISTLSEERNAGNELLLQLMQFLAGQ